MVPSTLRKALGTVKDQTSIRIAKVTSDTIPELDVAIVKATSHDEDPAEERHIREILNLTTFSKENVCNCIIALSRRLRKTHNWIVALKILMLMHRLLTNGNPYFQFQIFFTTHKGTRLLNMSDFHDEAHSNSSSHSAFVRAYALYLDQTLQVMCDEDRLHIYDHGYDNKSHSQAPLKDMKHEKVLGRMSQLQQLLNYVLDLRPTGIAKDSRLIMTALYPIAKDSFQLYAYICEILAELLDRFFDMEYKDCMKSFDAYSSAAKQIDELDDFYSWCKDVGVAKSSEFPVVQRISSTLLRTLEEFMKDRRRTKTIGGFKVPEPALKPAISKEQFAEMAVEVKKEEEVNLLDLREDAVCTVDYGNELALALFSDDVFSGDGQSQVADKGASDWEIALVESASLISKQEENLPNGFNPFVLDDLYGQGAVNQYVHVNNVESKHNMVMQGQTDVGSVDNGCMHSNAGMEHFGTPPPSNGNSAFYFPPPY